MIKDKSHSKVMDMVEEELLTSRKYRDNYNLLEDFCKIRYSEPKHHRAKDIQRIIGKKV